MLDRVPLRRTVWVACLLLLLFPIGEAAASPRAQVDRIEFRGNDRTRKTTLLELLPRSPPARYSEDELLEYERRLLNLGIFDQVTLSREGRVVRVRVREKWTLLPAFDFATGKTWRDLYIQLGATEYNAFGTAT